MAGERWERVKAVFEEAVELPPDRRREYLRRACGTDRDLALEIERLLSAHDGESGVLARSTEAAAWSGWQQPAENLLSPGDRLAGRFRVLEFVGRGGMGEVYRVEDLALGGLLALKTLRPEFLSDQGLQARFRREIQLARQVTHPNVCRVFDAGWHESPAGKLAFLTMEFLDGETLTEHLRSRGRLPPEEALPLIRQMALGLAALTEENIVHRDFKPGNVILTRNPGGTLRAVVTDFGLARGKTYEPKPVIERRNWGSS